MTDLNYLAKRPVFFERNRVFRVYRGGKLFHGFFGDEAADGFFPEEWIASDVKALNGKERDPHEGISKVKDSEIYFDELIREQKELMIGNRDRLGLLVKALDSASRLPVQVHPDKAFSKKHFASGFGKCEMWVVLDTRENACIYLGFREKITRQEFKTAIRADEAGENSLETLLNRVPVNKGDVYFIAPKTVHAIGAGCFMLEIQEPADFTIQPESRCGSYKLSDYERYLGLDEETALDCFDFSTYGKSSVESTKRTPQTIYSDGAVISQRLTAESDSVFFTAVRHRINGGCIHGLNAPATYVVTDGGGTLEMNGYAKDIKKGGYFFMPQCLNGKITVNAPERLELLECLPPMAE
jgi:mannose-6-phosphate isomerase